MKSGKGERDGLSVYASAALTDSSDNVNTHGNATENNEELTDMPKKLIEMLIKLKEDTITELGVPSSISSWNDFHDYLLKMQNQTDILQKDYSYWKKLAQDRRKQGVSIN